VDTIGSENITKPLTFLPEQLWDARFRFLKIKKGDKSPTYDMVKWQENNFAYNDEVFMNHVINGGSYGIIGGYGNLILIDADSKEIEEIAERLPQTFTVKSGSEVEYKKHYYYYCEPLVAPIRLSKEKLGDLGDVRSTGQYVVGPNCLHPSGNYYTVIRDIPIKTISKELIEETFKDYTSKQIKEYEKKEFPLKTKLRNTKFVKECNVPDYLLNNKIKGNSSKNWELFPAIVDILYSRQVTQKVYERIAETQGHDVGAIKGWVKLAHEGKLKNSSCKEMRAYLDRHHPELKEEICGNCPLYKKQKVISEISSNEDLTNFQKDILILLVAKEREKATEKIVMKIESENHIFTTRDDNKSEMWIYKNGIYVPEGKTYVKEYCRKLFDFAFTTNLVNNVIAKIEADTYIDSKFFFSHNYINEIPVLNGILNIRTREISNYDPKKIFFNKIPIEYDPSAECNSILEHFKSILKNEDDIPVILELFGYLLFKEYKIEKAFMFVGSGRNGKSKTIELMKKFVGPENCSSLPLRCLTEDSFSLSELFGKMANLAADLSKTDLKETGMIKSLIGRDTIQSKRKFLSDLYFVNYAKMVFAANELPRIYDTTDGFWTKWVLIEFPFKFVTQKVLDSLNEEEKKKHKIIDTDIVKRITTPEEMSGLLNLALDGLDRLLENNDFSYSKSTMEVKDLWIRQSDSFTAFCYDFLEESPFNRVSKKEIRLLYHNYCKKHKIPKCSDKAIKITLENMFGVSDEQISSGERIWEGIKVKDIIHI
jgi:P4 family phage/plasmid primase-like protien